MNLEERIHKKTILFFDGQCGLCSRFITFVFKRDIQKNFLYAMLQGETAKQHLKKEDIEGLKSIIVLTDGVILREAHALRFIIKKLYPFSSFVLYLIPVVFLNIFYRWVAKKRYKFFKKTEMLYKLTKEKPELFLP